MQFDKRYLAMAAAALMVLTAVGLCCSDPSDADQTYTRDYGEFYSYTLQFVFDGADAQTITWDFGDQTAVSHEWNPRHTYATTGTFYVRQTTTNTIGTTEEIYKVTIRGFPVITFESNGGSSVPQMQTTGFSQKATAPADPTKTGYVFAGWFTDSLLTQAFDWSTDIVRSMTLYAKWTAATPEPTPSTSTVEVTFDVDGGSTVVAKRIVTPGSQIVLPAYAGTKVGYEFVGWSSGNISYQANSTITVNADMVLKAIWRPVSTAPSQYTVTFDVNGGSVAVAQATVTSGVQFTFPAYSGSKTGYEFAGWEYGQALYKPGAKTTFTGNVTVKAVWQSASADPDQGGASEEIVDKVTEFVQKPEGMAAIVLVVVLVVGFAYFRSRRMY